MFGIFEGLEMVNIIDAHKSLVLPEGKCTVMCSFTIKRKPMHAFTRFLPVRLLLLGYYSVKGPVLEKDRHDH